MRDLLKLCKFAKDDFIIIDAQSGCAIGGLNLNKTYLGYEIENILVIAVTCVKASFSCN